MAFLFTHTGLDDLHVLLPIGPGLLVFASISFIAAASES